MKSAPRPTSPQKSPAAKPTLHPRNRHRGRYDFPSLVAAVPELAGFVAKNAYGDESIDFANPAAVKLLNRALLQSVYGVQGWDIPAGYLCPPIPGRADYVHCVADLLAEGGAIPRGARVLDVGVGANGVYPLIGQHEYGWQFVGAEVDRVAIENLQRILAANAGLSEAIELRWQASPKSVFHGIIQTDERFELTMCNPPFHASVAEAKAGTQRKWKNLGHGAQPTLNFGGQGRELCCEGGELAFVCRMVEESVHFRGQCLWFTTLISKATNLPSVYRALQRVGAVLQHTIPMGQGQKQSRLVAWTFLNAAQRQAWRAARWGKTDK
ncbi:MAG: 23S rRNA (adenine(1618)-N(6))-methyltransferase RlmF [Gallionella sp.]|nr:23S rRNA (adenine(1618)-N(6))-methyltransferase RlmF [Gallionella sp.]